jgi:hypothetical protein
LIILSNNTKLSRGKLKNFFKNEKAVAMQFNIPAIPNRRRSNREDVRIRVKS